MLGHGGTDPGAINESKNIYEKNVNLKIANYLKTELEQYYNVKVILTHDGTTFPNNDCNDLAARAMVARNNNADLYVSLHVNSSENSSLNGANVYVTYRTDLEKYNAGMTVLGNKILANLSSLGIKNNGVLTKLCIDDSPDPKYRYYDKKLADYYGDIRYAMKGTTSDYGADLKDGSGIPTVLIEHCYLSNSYDVTFIDSNADLKKIAQADAKAIAEYLELQKIPFTDVKTTDWFYTSVKYNYDNGYIMGTTSTTFTPNSNITRGDLVTILWRMEGSKKVTSGKEFPDVNSSDYYYYAIKWASTNGIVSGYDNGKFGPKDKITREQLAVMLRNYAKYKGKNSTSTASLTKYTDNTKVSSYAKTAVQWAVATGVISGKDNGKRIDPQGTATRAEAAAMIYNFCTKIK